MVVMWYVVECRINIKSFCQDIDTKQNVLWNANQIEIKYDLKQYQMFVYNHNSIDIDDLSLI